ncbi:alpha/beta hydrolase [Conyzicola nivalis]|uniref:Lipase n=1 Tax=Conyzicola nivalis TaxID=1477021 RepID=A0A916WIE7_9MICO|nr:alpha/beta hydrolase [Conyzicola nivalis]GGB00678.1 lipase [Conyzicola nivalis]
MPRRSRPWIRRKRNAIPLALLASGLGVLLVSLVSPWPAALLIRLVFEKGAADTVAEMEPYAPADGVGQHLDVSYADGGAHTTLDVFTPEAGNEALPTVVWIHGGAWISGDKRDIAPYARILADRGYTVVTLNYTVSPETTYPTALNELNTALGFLSRNAADYRIDPTRFVIAGDSAGSQFTSQLATVVTNPDYARLLGVDPAIDAEQLRAVILNCGIYDVSGIPDVPGIGGWGFRTALWSYIGDRDWSRHPAGQEMSTVDYVTEDFPQTWISGGNGDPLTATQSRPFASRLEALGVPVTGVFYDTDHAPSLPHEYQFHLDFVDARAALESTVRFLDSVTC